MILNHDNILLMNILITISRLIGVLVKLLTQVNAQMITCFLNTKTNRPNI